MWGVILFWKCWPPALTLEARPMSIYNSRFYSKASRSAQSLPSKCTMTPCAQGLLGPCPRPVPPIESGWMETGRRALLCLRPSIALSSASSELREMRSGEGAGDHFPCDSLSSLRWGRQAPRGGCGKDFPLHKEHERGSRVPVASCQAPGMRQPWELAPGQTPQGLLTWESWLSGSCQEYRQWSFGECTFES